MNVVEIDPLIDDCDDDFEGEEHMVAHDHSHVPKQ